MPQHTYSPTTFPLLLLSVVILSVSCGWGTASRVYDQKPDPTPEPKVLFVQGPNGTPTETPPKPNIAATASTSASKSGCPVKFFTVQRMDTQRKQTKEIFCSNGHTANLNQSALSEDIFRRDRLDNIPEDQWYLLVDPNKTDPAGSMTLTNEQLLQLSKVYKIKYHNKMISTGYIIYILASDTPNR